MRQERKYSNVTADDIAEFNAPQKRITSVETQIKSGPKTLEQLRKSVGGGTESILDCLSVLIDLERVTASYTKNGEERLYFKKAQPYQTYRGREMGVLQRSDTDRPMFWAEDVRPTTRSTRSKSYN